MCRLFVACRSAAPESAETKRYYPGSLEECHRLYLRWCEDRSHPEHKMGFTTYVSLKPWYVHPLNETHRSICGCIVHNNVEELFHALLAARRKLERALATAVGDQAAKQYMESVQCGTEALNSCTRMMDLLLCVVPNGARWRRIECYKGTCADCGVRKLPLLPHELSGASHVEVCGQRVQVPTCR